MVAEIEIEQIVIGKRFRSTRGDLDQLAASIQAVGLIQPVVLDKNNRLIAGRRRIQACQLLKMTRIPYIRKPGPSDGGADAHAHECEIAENTQRKALGLREIERIKAHVVRVRKSAGVKEDAVEGGKPPGTGPKSGHRQGGLMVAGVDVGAGKTNTIVGQLTGRSPRQIAKISSIIEAANKDPNLECLIDDCESGKKTVNTAHILATRRKRSLPPADMPSGVYDVILADVPIRYDSSTRSDHAANHYPTMSVDELCGMEVPAADDAVVFFWMPPSIKYHLCSRPSGDTPIYKAILDAWGFPAVKGEICWDKQHMGMGSWTRGQHETCMIAVRGKPPRPARSYPSVLRAARTQYSRKPDVLYGMIEEMYPGRQYLEMFGRARHSDKWKVYGNEVGKFSEAGSP